MQLRGTAPITVCFQGAGMCVPELPAKPQKYQSALTRSAALPWVGASYLHLCRTMSNEVKLFH